MLDLSPELINAIESRHQFCHIVTLYLSTTVRYTDNDIDILHNGDTYQAKAWLGMGDAKQSSKPQVNKIQLEFGLSDQTLLNIIGGAPWMNSKIVIERVYLDDNYNVIGTLHVKTGRMDNHEQTHNSKKSTITISGSTNWADHEKEAGTKCNVESQQRFYPDDYGYELATLISDDEPWGKKSITGSSQRVTTDDEFEDKRYNY
jgi:hypothetical protein